MPTLRLITDAAVERGCAAEIVAFEASKTALGLTVLPRVDATGMAPNDLRARQSAVRPDYSILIGDNVPVVYVAASPDGHGVRNLFGCKLFATDGAIGIGPGNVASPPSIQPYGAVSRVWYAAQPGAGVPSLELYRRWLLRAAARPGRSLRFRPLACVDDHFAYALSADQDYHFIGENARAQVPRHLLQDLRQVPATGDNTDGIWAQWAAAPVMVGYSLSGGYEFPEMVGLYNIGRTEELRRILPVVDLHVIWGSFQMDYTWPNNLPVAATTIDCTTAVLSQYGRMPLSAYYAGKPIGASSRAFMTARFFGQPQDYLLDILGDCSMALTADQLAISDLTDRITRIEADVAGMKVSGVQQASAPLRINCGGPAAGGFAADAGYIGGIVAQIDAAIAVAGVANAAPSTCYQSMRAAGEESQDQFAYRFTGLVPAKPYTLRLHFAEMWHTKPGQRLFNILANGALLLANVDVYARAGGARACVIDLLAPANDAGAITLSFVGTLGASDPHPMCSAIEVIS